MALLLALVLGAPVRATAGPAALDLGEYLGLIERYAAGESRARELAFRAPTELSDALRSLLNSRPPVCSDERCREAAALLHTEAGVLGEAQAASGVAHVHLDIAAALLRLHGPRSKILGAEGVTREHASFRQAWLRVVGRLELGNAPTESNGRLLRATDPEELIDRFRAIAREARASYVLEFQLDPHARAGWHDLDVRVRLRGATVRARRGYFLAR